MINYKYVFQCKATNINAPNKPSRRKLEIRLLLLDNEGKKPIGGTRPIADARRYV